MSDILCVTNRTLCHEDFLQRIEKIAAAHPAGILLREKDLTPEEYKKLAEKVLEICKVHNTPCILHTFASVARELGSPALHLPLSVLRTLSLEERSAFSALGGSCHSAADAIEAQALGCTYITAGHVFDTDCKKGLPGRGLAFLREVTENVSIPVYAIGGICPENMDSVRETGAAGACVMSGAMVCENPAAYLAAFLEKPAG